MQLQENRRALLAYAAIFRRDQLIRKTANFLVFAEAAQRLLLLGIGPNVFSILGANR
jgi:hypothetical protein